MAPGCDHRSGFRWQPHGTLQVCGPPLCPVAWAVLWVGEPAFHRALLCPRPALCHGRGLEGAGHAIMSGAGALCLRGVSVSRRPLRVPLQATARGEAAAPGLAPHGYRLPPRVREAAWAPCCVGRLCPLNTHEPKASGPGRDARGAGSFWGDELRWAWKWWPSVVAPRAVRSGRVTCAVSVPCRMDGVTGLQGPCLPVSALRGAPLSLPGQGSPGTGPPPAGPLASQPSCVRSVRALVPPGPQLQT